MVAVAQLVEPRIVIPVVEGSSPFSHPIFFPEFFAYRHYEPAKHRFVFSLNGVYRQADNRYNPRLLRMW